MFPCIFMSFVSFWCSLSMFLTWSFLVDNCVLLLLLTPNIYLIQDKWGKWDWRIVGVVEEAEEGRDLRPLCSSSSAQRDSFDDCKYHTLSRVLGFSREFGRASCDFLRVSWERINWPTSEMVSSLWGVCTTLPWISGDAAGVTAKIPNGPFQGQVVHIYCFHHNFPVHLAVVSRH